MNKINRICTWMLQNRICTWMFRNRICAWMLQTYRRAMFKMLTGFAITYFVNSPKFYAAKNRNIARLVFFAYMFCHYGSFRNIKVKWW